MKINKANLSVLAVKATDPSRSLHGIRFDKGGTIGCNGFSLAYVSYPNRNEESEQLEPFMVVFDIGGYKKYEEINLDVQHTNKNGTAKFTAVSRNVTNEFALEKLPTEPYSNYPPVIKIIEDNKKEITEKEHIAITLSVGELRKILEVVREIDNEVTFYIPKEYLPVKMVAKNDKQEFFGLTMPIKK